MRTTTKVCAVVVAVVWMAGCRRADDAQSATAPAVKPQQVPQSLAMGGAKSVMTFFVTSAGPGKVAISAVWREPMPIALRWRKRRARAITSGERT